MTKFTITVLVTLLTIFGCSSVKQSPDFSYGSGLYSKYIDTTLKGNNELAELNFYKAVDVFQRMDDFCNISRLYISRYVLEPEHNIDFLAKSKEMGILQNCEEELNVVSYLLGESFNEKTLAEPYSIIHKAEAKNNPKLLVEYAKDEKNNNDESRSRMYRLAASKYIKSDPENAEILIKEAQIIDGFNGWTVNLISDIELLISVYSELKKDTTNLLKRKALLEKKLVKK